MILTHMYEDIESFVFLQSFWNCPSLSFVIPHSQHVSSNLECADRRKAYFLSLKEDREKMDQEITT